VGYDNTNIIGTVNVGAGHIVAARDFMIIGTPTNSARIWTGNWAATTSVPVSGDFPAPLQGDPVACSCGASGNGHFQYVVLDTSSGWFAAD
jgi:hypothetical protein